MKNTIKVNPQIKTVKFEARPMWETAFYAKKFSSEASLDIVRKENYPKVKEILDNYARLVIDMATKMLTVEGLTPTCDNLRKLYFESRNRANKDAVKHYEKAVKDFKNHIVEVIKQYGTERQLIKAQGDLFNEKKSCLLNDVALLKLTAEEKELIRLYHGFTGYFSKYFDSLSKTILCGTEHGSIANRIMDNMERYFQNEAILAEIAQSYPELYAELESGVAKMDVSDCLWQEGIDAYNMLLGNVYNCGINSIINEYRQKNKVMVLGLKQLYKIPLCKKEKQMVIRAIETEQELATVISDSIVLSEELISFAKRLIGISFTSEDMKGIYVKASALSGISKDVFGVWDKLGRVADSYCDVHDVSMEDALSLYLLEKAIAYDEDIAQDKSVKCSIIDSLKEKLTGAISAEKQISMIKRKCEDGSVLNNKKVVKEFYEKLLLIQQALRIFDLEKIESSFIEDVLSMQEKMQEMDTNYNMVRNFCTRAPFKKGEYPLSFNKSSCLSSFDYDKLMKGESISSILRKDGLYYLLILNPEHATKLPEQAKAKEGGYEQLVYKQLNGLNKMFPKVFLAKGKREFYQPSQRIIEIGEKKLYTKEADDRESCVEWIRFCIESFKKNKEWMKNFNPVFKKPEEYASANEFYTQLEKYTIRMDFSERIDEAYLRRAVGAGEVFLFMIYSKDFSPCHHGKDSAFTRLFKEMFSEENLYKINHTTEAAIKLTSGGSQLTFRRASLPFKETHPANVPIKNKNPLNKKEESVFAYPLMKDRRYMVDSYRLSLAIQVGFRNEEVNRYELNRRVNEEVLEQMPNMLTVRAGERHLLYYVVTDPKGNVLEQNSLNIIRFKNDRQEVKTDYKELLIEREREIEKAKEEWNYSVDIKDIKAGYMSQAIHVIVKLQERYNAVIFLEDYSGSFVQGRMKNIKTVYQQFQKALLQKLSCYIPEGKGYGSAIQLACPVSSLDDLKGQSGIVYFVNPSYTANVDPTTGFANQYYEYFRYESLKKARNTLSKITDIHFDEAEQDYKILISEKEFGVSSLDTKRVLHTKGIRTIFKDKKYQEYDCTELIKKLCKEYGVFTLDEMRKKDLDKRFYERLFEIIQVTLRMHYFSNELEEEYVLSPVQNKDGVCFDSRTQNAGVLIHSSAVKTCLLGKKGMCDLYAINKETLFVERDAKGTHKEKWLNYLQTSVS